MRILVAEDERVLANTIATALRAALEADVDVAFDGGTAQEFVRSNEYELVVIDFCLPPPTGLELVGRWKAAGCAPPILMMSGGDGKTRRLDALAAGAADCLEKPFPLAELILKARSSIGTAERTG